MQKIFMVNLLEAAVLAILQGLTEWLPISSSGHLVIIQQLFRIKASVAFDVMLHFGTLIAVVYFMRKDIAKLLKFDEESKRTITYIIGASLPIAFIGFAFKSFFESLFSDLLAVALALILNGFILYSTKFFQGKKKLDFSKSFAIGLAQAFSIIPGISRSGITISAGLMSKIDKKQAYKFSFLLSILAILGATFFKLGEINFTLEPIEAILLGIAISALVGYFSLKTLAKSVLSNNFHKFAYYCWLLGFSILLLSFL
jgi:undecaprenyl-diphosphatase